MFSFLIRYKPVIGHRRMRLRCFWTCFGLLLGFPLLAQQIAVELSNPGIPIDQYFTISVSIEGGELESLDLFPEIEGFKKSSRFATTTTTTVAGRATVTKSITQRYAALSEGIFELKPFSLKVNGQVVSSPGTTITVRPMGTDSDDPLTAREEEETPAPPSEEPPEYLDVREDAFLSLGPAKKEVYVGEGVQVTLWFYLAATDQHLLEFYDFANQIPAIIGQLRQENAWEESLEQLGEVLPESIRLDNKEYLRYQLYSAVYYPLNAEPLTFPSVSLKMIKYKIANDPTFAGDYRQVDYKTYTSRVKTVTVRELPPHPLRQTVPVGVYRLQDNVDKATIEAGKGFTYFFRVEGEGNLAAVQAPEPPAMPALKVYPPEVTQQVNRQRAGVAGTKVFRYHMLARQPGKIDLGNLFRFVYFNPALDRYDTLGSALTVNVTGERDADAVIQSKDLGQFYNLIRTEDNTLVSLHKFEETKRYTNLVVLLLLAVTLVMFFKK